MLAAGETDDSGEHSLKTPNALLAVLGIGVTAA